ncbi:MAG: flagellar export protein FliJ [Lachnospiraceae bacterium]|nr:flagellar export protein FliJ [Lachnospiraceae bacterium]
MAKFIYRMQSILDVKLKMEEQARMEFATARMRLDEEEEKLNVLIQRKADYEEQGRELRKNALNVFDILENKQALERMDELILIQKDAVLKAERLLDEARMKLQVAMQESKTQEKLKEKAFEEFVRELNAQEAKEVDELTSYTYGQKKAE